MLWKCSIPLALKSASLVSNIWLLKKGPSPTVEGIIGNIGGIGENQADLDRVFVTNSVGSGSVHREPAALSWALLVLLLVHGEEFSSTALRKRFSTSVSRFILSLPRSTLHVEE
jgi:hypothetical protein